jgi:hypothetical protein
METVEKKDTTVADVLKNIVDKNPEGGEVTIKVLEKELPSMTRTDIIRQLRRSNLGAFITGRRGKPSRFLYGAPAISHLHRDETPRRQVSPVSRRQESTASTEESPSHGIELRINVGGQITTIPIKLELGVAA